MYQWPAKYKIMTQLLLRMTIRCTSHFQSCFLVRKTEKFKAIIWKFRRIWPTKVRFSNLIKKIELENEPLLCSSSKKLVQLNYFLGMTIRCTYESFSVLFGCQEKQKSCNYLKLLVRNRRIWTTKVRFPNFIKKS